MSPTNEVSPVQGTNLYPIDAKMAQGGLRQVSEAEAVDFQNMMVQDSQPVTGAASAEDSLTTEIIDNLKEELGEIGFQRLKESWFVTGVTDEQFALSYNSFVMNTVSAISENIQQIEQANKES